MGQEEVNRIKQEFTSLHLHPRYIEHKSALTSEEVAKIRGSQLKQGIKSMLFTDGKEDFVIANVPADKRVDQKKVADQMNWSPKQIRLCTPEEVMEKTGCEIGAVPPFGHKTQIPLLVDKGVYDNKENEFNIGLRTQSVNIPSKEIKIVFKKLKAIEGNFEK